MMDENNVEGDDDDENAIEDGKYFLNMNKIWAQIQVVNSIF